MNILAIDPGTKCGWAHSCGASGVWNLRVRRDESGGMRLIRLRAKLDEIRRDVGVDLVVYEAARHAAPKMQSGLVVTAMLQGQIMAWCEQHRIDYRGYSPSEVKRCATGKGNAGKAAVVAAARRRWPSVRVLDDNHADALWLLELAQLEYAAAAERRTA